MDTADEAIDTYTEITYDMYTKWVLTRDAKLIPIARLQTLKIAHRVEDKTHENMHTLLIRSSVMNLHTSRGEA